MKQQVLDILRRTAGRLARNRLAEMAAVTVTAALLSAAALEGAWSLAILWPVGASLVCLLLVVAGGLLIFQGVRDRLGLELLPAAITGGLCVAVGLLGAAVVGLGACNVVPRAALAPGMLLAGLLAGFVAAQGRRVTLEDAAVFLDVHCHTGERLSTAVELSGSDQADASLAQCVYGQALGALRKNPAENVRMWKRTPATLGALGLAVLLSAGAWFLPAGGQESEGSLGRQMAESMQSLSVRQKKELADAFRSAAKGAGDDAKLSASLLDAARVIEVDDPQKLQEVIAMLEKQGFHPLEVVPQDLRMIAGLNGENRPGMPAHAPAPVVATNGMQQGTSGLLTVAAGDANGSTYVNVYDPLYAKSGTPPVGDANTKPIASGSVSYGDAWLAARKAAAENLASGRTPVAYRQMVRDFFALAE